VLPVGNAPLAPGSYNVTAYFGDNTPIPGVTLSNAYYQPVAATGNINVLDITAPETLITSGPPTSTNPSASFVFTGTDGN
jgi:hypothetical protein